MAKVIYKLTADEAEVIQNKDGSVTLVFEEKLDDDNMDVLECPDASGEYQSDMLWENFKHDFTAYDDDGNEVEYDD